MNSGRSIAAPTLSADFQSSDGLHEAALTHLAQKYGPNGASLKDGHLTLILHIGYARFGAELIEAIEHCPSIKKNISFRDRGALRSFDDVVWDLEQRGIELARKIYNNEDERNKTRLLISTPPRGSHGGRLREIYCHSVFEDNARGKVQLRPLLATDRNWSAAEKHSGLPRIIQTDRISLEPTDDPLNQTMRISTRTPFNYPLNHAPRHEHHI